MYRPAAYARDDRAELHAFVNARAFATIAGSIDGRVQFAYSPVLLDRANGKNGAVRFHLARANPLAAAHGMPLRLSFLGPDSYISPDWYAHAGYVPTWNYVAVEGEGIAQRLDATALRQLVIELSASQETRLQPKKPWTHHTMPEEKLAALLNAIVGFSVAFETLHGKFKLSQDKTPDDVAGVIAHLEALADPRAQAMADAMGVRLKPAG